MRLRLYVEQPLAGADEFALPAAAARHAQVRRVQPGDALVLFDGSGREWPAAVTAMARAAVRVRIAGAPVAVDRELPFAVLLAVAVPANDRMDAFVEKATELGVARLQPLVCERSVLRLDGERAARRRAHWQAIAIAAAEQCGRARVPAVAPLVPLPNFLNERRAEPQKLVLSLDDGAAAAATLRAAATCALSGPEGGLTPAEEAAAVAAGFAPLSLGPRVLRADTAPLALLARVALQ